MEGLSYYTKLINMAASVCVCVCVAATSSVPGTNQLRLKPEGEEG